MLIGYLNDETSGYTALYALVELANSTPKTLVEYDQSIMDAAKKNTTIATLSGPLFLALSVISEVCSRQLQYQIYFVYMYEVISILL